jgi:hypothetical protein
MYWSTASRGFGNGPWIGNVAAVVLDAGAHVDIAAVEPEGEDGFPVAGHPKAHRLALQREYSSLRVKSGVMNPDDGGLFRKLNLNNPQV